MHAEIEKTVFLKRKLKTVIAEGGGFKSVSIIIPPMAILAPIIDKVLKFNFNNGP